MMDTCNLQQPRLACNARVKNGEIYLRHHEVEFALEPDGSSIEELHEFMSHLDGTQTVQVLEKHMDAGKRRRFVTLLQDLDRYHLLDEGTSSRVRSGTRALLEIEDLANSLMEQTLYRNIFWTTILGKPGTFPKSLLYGLAIENYHFLFRESLFDSPVLPYLANTKVRQLMNEFYIEEYGHDELILRALLALGITREDMVDSMPLPETLAMCNALSHWASCDPLFFFTTLGILEGKDPEVDVYIQSCQQNGLDPKFVTPMKAHSDINRKGEHGNLTRLLFKEIACIDDETMHRMKRQMHLFVQMYDDFYTAIWKHYSHVDDLVRRQSSIYVQEAVTP